MATYKIVCEVESTAGSLEEVEVRLLGEGFVTPLFSEIEGALYLFLYRDAEEIAGAVLPTITGLRKAGVEAEIIRVERQRG